jgi:hypothetical protein
MCGVWSRRLYPNPEFQRLYTPSLSAFRAERILGAPLFSATSYAPRHHHGYYHRLPKLLLPLPHPGLHPLLPPNEDEPSPAGSHRTKKCSSGLEQDGDARWETSGRGDDGLGECRQAAGAVEWV